MSPSQPARKISRNFVYPAGSQVVLQVTLETQGGSGESSSFKKPGSVGVVTKCPPHNDQPYLVQFADDSITEASFDELVLRREEVDMLLSSQSTIEELKPFIIYRCKVGSKAFGLSSESSDDDIRGIFLPPANLHWSLYELPEQLEFNEGDQDEVFWELEKFLRLALKANPNILETLWTPLVLEANPIATKLREIRDAFLSKHIFKTYSGYAISQFRKMRNSFKNTGKFKHKHAMHLIRLLYSGIGVLRTGEIMVDVSEFRSELLEIRSGHYSFEEVESKARELEKQFEAAFEQTDLPEQPDFAVVNQFLLEARRFAAEQESHGS